MVSEHNLGSAYAFSQYVTIRRSFSQEEEMYRREKDKTLAFRGRNEEKLSKLLFQTMQSIHEDIKKMRREMCKESPRGFEYEENHRFLHDGCENSATQFDPQRSFMPIFTAREMEEEDAPKEETLSDYLQEYESQSWRFKEHLNFQYFFKIKEERRPINHNKSKRGRFFLPNFDGSSKCTTKDWIEQLDSYLQLHQVS